MYAFVSFVFPEIVTRILKKRNPHYIRGARVLVKPYKEKSRIERNYMKASMYYPTHIINMEPESSSSSDYHRSIINSLFMDEHDSMLDLERNHFSELSISQNQLNQPQRLEELNFSEGPSELPVQDHFSYTLDALNNNMATSTENENHDQDSHQLQLPDSPFATSVVESSTT